jgi:Ca-activated chloride channel homolog
MRSKRDWGPEEAPSRSRRARGYAAASAGLAMLLLSAVACTGSTAAPVSPSPGLTGPAYTLQVLASTDLTDMTPILEEAQQATGVTVKLHLTATLTGAQEVADGTAAGKYDAVWFASDDYLELLNGGLTKLAGTTEIMTSPVVIGVRTSAARRLGWDNKPVTWADIAEAAAKGEFTFGMGDPRTSNSGLMGLASVATSLAGNGAALQQNEIAGASPLLTSLFHAQTLTEYTSSALAGSYRSLLKNAEAKVPDGLIDYESQLLTLQAQTGSEDPLTLIYPSDGATWATYPLSALASAPATAKDAYLRLAAYLRTPRVQEQIMNITHRRPIVSGISLTASLRGHQPFELPFPGTASTVEDLVDVYEDKLVRATQTVYVLDTSGSMAGTRLAGLKQALLALTGVDTSLSGQFAVFRSREEVTLLPFNSAPGTPETLTIPELSPGPVLARMRSRISSLTAGGSTAIYDSLVKACQILATQRTADPGLTQSIVLLTDGENNTGWDLAQFLARYRTQGSDRPPVYAIALGDADLQQLDRLAAATGGEAFNATTQPVSALHGIFEDIRGYQE